MKTTIATIKIGEKIWRLNLDELDWLLSYLPYNDEITKQLRRAQFAIEESMLENP